jgi:hypothetical protein
MPQGEIYWRNVYSIPLGITISGTRNPPEEWDSAGNTQFIDEECPQGMGLPQELLAQERWPDMARLVGSKCAKYSPNGRPISRSAIPTLLQWKSQLKKKIKYKNVIPMKNKPALPIL